MTLAAGLRATLGEQLALDLLDLLDLEAPPAPAMDRYLDALSRCIARFGLGRVSVQDVAREAKVDRTTVYRQVGPIRQQMRLLAARDIARALSLVPTGADGPVTVDDVIATMGDVVALASAHPIMARLRADDGDVVTLGDIHQMQRILPRAAAVLAPLLDRAMDEGWFARRDAGIVAGWIVSTIAWLVLMPPAGADVRAVLAEVVRPVLSPAG